MTLGPAGRPPERAWGREGERERGRGGERMRGKQMGVLGSQAERPPEGPAYGGGGDEKAEPWGCTCSLERGGG